MSNLSIQCALITPILGAVGIWYFSHRPNLRDALTLLTASILFFIVLHILFDVLEGRKLSWQLIEMLPGLSIYFEIEPLGMIFAVVASLLWIVTSIYAIGYMRGHNEKNQTRFYIFFAIAISSTIGIAFSGNMLTLFIFYEILTLSTFPLVTHSGSSEAKRAGRVYLGILLGTSICFQLVAIIWTWFLAETLSFEVGGILNSSVGTFTLSILLGLYVFGIGKAALMPFHSWLPSAMVAPTPVSALLHAVAVVKAGVFTVLKITIYVFGLDTLQDLDVRQLLQYIAAFTIIVSSLIAMSKDNLKARLAYSTVSQLSYIILAAMLANDISAIGGGMHIVMHAFGKITLFFCAGAIMVACHKTEISQMHGLGRKMPLTFFCFLLGSLCIVGVPPFGGMWSKWFIVLGSINSGNLIFVVVLILSSLLSLVYFIPIVVRGFFSKSSDVVHHGPTTTTNTVAFVGDASGPKVISLFGFQEAPLPCLVAISISCLGCIVLFFSGNVIYNFLLLSLEY